MQAKLNLSISVFARA